MPTAEIEVVHITAVLGAGADAMHTVLRANHIQIT
jgi:hypothetical protein